MRPTQLSTTLLALALGSVGIFAQNGMAQSKTYTDSATGIDFLGYADGTGYQFGFVLPQNPKSDTIIQLVSPLKNGGGWAGVDFGEYMTGRLLLVAWPNGNKVMVSPRIATGYEIDNGGNPYTKQKLTMTPIEKGTFVNSTHVSATFVCGNCLNADSFTAQNETATFAFAYAFDPVKNPSDEKTLLSDHTANGEPYGPFGVTLKDAESANYAKFAAMTGTGGNGGARPSGTGGSTPAPSITAGGSASITDSGSSSSSTGDAGSSLGSSSGGSGSSGSSGSSTGSAGSAGSTGSSTEAGGDSVSKMGGGFWMLMLGVVCLYLAQPFMG